MGWQHEHGSVSTSESLPKRFVPGTGGRLDYSSVWLAGTRGVVLELQLQMVGGLGVRRCAYVVSPVDWRSSGLLWSD